MKKIKRLIAIMCAVTQVIVSVVFISDNTIAVAQTTDSTDTTILDESTEATETTVPTTLQESTETSTDTTTQGTVDTESIPNMTFTVLEGSNWTDNNGYSFSILKYTNDNKEGYCVGFTGYSGSEVSLTLGKQVEIPEEVKQSIGDIVIDDSDHVTALYNECCKCSSATHFDLTGIKYICDNSFAGNPNKLPSAIPEINIPSTVKYLGTGIFAYSGIQVLNVECKLNKIPNYFCMDSLLNTINFTDESSIESIGNSAFCETYLTEYPLSYQENNVIIGISSFANCYYIKSLSLPNNVTKISNSAFAECSRLRELTLGNKVSYLDDRCFNRCGCLTTIKFNNNLEHIGEYCFEFCDLLKEVSGIPDSTSLGIGVFSSCYNLQSADLPDCMTEIPNETFYNCTSLTNVTFGENVSDVGNNAFLECESITRLDFNKEMNTIGSGAFTGCSSLECFGFHVCSCLSAGAFQDCINLVSVDIMANEYGKGVFCGCSNLTYINLNTNALTSIPYEFFAGCSSLKSLSNLDFSKTTTVEDSAFIECSSIEDITLDNVNSFGKWSFCRCANLKSISTKPLSASTYNDSCFNGCKLFNPEFSDDVIPRIGAYAFSGTAITNLNLSSTTASEVNIGGYAFSNCKMLTEITIDLPETCTYNFGECLFIGCTNLKSIVYSGTEIFQSMFMNCTSLNNLNFSNTITVVDNEGFKNCTSLSYFNFKATTHLGKSCFENSGLQDTLQLPNTILIDESAFKGCNSLRRIIVNADKIGNMAFANCCYLETAMISANYIGSLAFMKNPSLSNVFLWNFGYHNLSKIDNLAFYICPKLKDIIIPESVTNINSRSLGYSYWTTTYEDFFIVGTVGSAAQQYAESNGFKFISINDYDSKFGIITQNQPGDITNNGAVTYTDVSLLQSYISGKVSKDNLNIEMADLNSDGKVNSLDLAILKSMVLAN